MSLLYTLTAYPPYLGGAQLHQHHLAQQIGPHHGVQVVSCWDTHRTDWLLGTTLRAPNQPRAYTVDGVAVHRLGLSWGDKLRIAPWLPLYYPLMSMALPQVARPLVRSLHPFAATANLVHNVRIGREALTYASWQVARQRDIPFVLTPVHHPRWTGWRYRQYLRLYRAADAVIALTQAEAKILADLGVSPERIHITGHGPIVAPTADPQGFRQRHRILGPMVLFLGQHYPYKGYRALLEAAPLLWKQHPEATLVFIGPAVGRSEQVFAAHADRRIRRLGTVPLQAKTDALAACDLLCVPSTQESFGGVYVEAWSFHKPVIGCPIPAVAEVVSDGTDGYLCAPEPTVLAERMTHLLDQPEVARALGEAGYAKVQARYTWPALATKTLAVYRGLGVGA